MYFKKKFFSLLHTSSGGLAFSFCTGFYSDWKENKKISFSTELLL